MEQIHAAAESQRRTQVIVALGMVAFATFALADAALSGWSSLGSAGMLLGTTGAAMLQWARHRATLRPKRLAF
ncbi:MAG TPA: hypothetical protein VEX86_25200 [Longimicrobium sp.]|nr:hypothetical protein [Longimicrobium sp.]